MQDALVLRGRFSEGEATLEGPGAGLRDLADRLRRQIDSTFLLTVPADSADPYLGWLTQIEFRPSATERVCIALAADVLVITGYSPALAQNIEFGADQGASGHSHIEYWPDHFFLDEASVPLVVQWTTD